MTPRNLFNIILKIFGLLFLREIIYIVPQLLATIPFFKGSNIFDEFNEDGLLLFVLTLASIAFYCFIIYQLLFRTDRLIDKLKLDRGFDQEAFSFNISRSAVLTISLIVIAGIVLTNEIPDFCRQVFLYFQ